MDTGAEFLGNWQYPNGSFVPSMLQTTSLYRSRGMRAVNLHRRTNYEASFSGIFTCTIPDSSSSEKTLNIFLHSGMLPGTMFFVQICDISVYNNIFINHISISFETDCSY